MFQALPVGSSAEAGMRWQQAAQPVPLPVQALDHATGYLMPAAALRGLVARQREGETVAARLSLARTAALLVGGGEGAAGSAFAGPREQDHGTDVENTVWGQAQRLRSPLRVWGQPIAVDSAGLAAGFRGGGMAGVMAGG